MFFLGKGGRGEGWGFKNLKETNEACQKKNAPNRRKKMGDGTIPRVRHVCSLGTVCLSSRMLKDTGLKRESYPFDWTFSKPNIIERILEDDFGQFLHRDLLVGNGSNQWHVQPSQPEGQRGALHVFFALRSSI